MQPNYRKRRSRPGPSKNELRAARNQRAEQEKTHAGTLRQRYPQVTRFELDLRLEAPTGIPLDHVTRQIDLDEPLKIDLPCPSTCGNGRFSLMETVETLLNSSGESREGMDICQAASYADSRTPCGTKLYYRITIQY